MEVGFGYAILGPMCAEKTTQLLRIANELRKENITYKIIKHPVDTRYGAIEQICSHNNERESCICVDDMVKFLDTNTYKSNKVFLIDETQFYDRTIVDFFDKAIIDGKIVIFAGLSGDFNMGQFGEIYNLVPKCEYVNFLNAKCYKCSKPAQFTSKVTGTHQTQEVGSVDMYKPCCREHYIKY